MKLIYKLFLRPISQVIAKYIRSRQSSVEDWMFWRSNLKDGECKKSLDCWDRTLETIAIEIERGKWLESGN